MKSKKGEIYTFSLCGKRVLWFSGINKYIVTQPGVDDIIKLIWDDPANSSIIEICKEKFDVDELHANRIKNDFIKHIEENIKSNNSTQQAGEKKGRTQFSDKSVILKKYYNINDRIFMVEYESEWAKQLNHPKFAHLEMSSTEKFDHHFKVFHSEGWFTLEVDGKSIGSWKESDSHFLGGKFSMQILQKLNNTEEEDWMGVFHAAGITDGNNCIMFFGGSGNGKSTLAALLMANGFDVLSDDFLPVTSCPELVCRFPAALSIKKTAYQLVSSTFNELNQAEEHYDPLQDKTFRYLPPLNTQKTSVPCKAIVYVKYQKGAGLNLEEMPHEEAFQHLVPDSWISPEPDNARRFVQWFSQLPCYWLTYSDNTKMVETVKKLFNNELS